MQRALDDVQEAEKASGGLPLFCWWPNRILLDKAENPTGNRHAYEVYERRALNKAPRPKKQEEAA